MAKPIGKFVDQSGRKMITMDMEDGTPPIHVPAAESGMSFDNITAPQIGHTISNENPLSFDRILSPDIPPANRTAPPSFDSKLPDTSPASAPADEEPPQNAVAASPNMPAAQNPNKLSLMTETSTQATDVSPRIMAERRAAAIAMDAANLRAQNAADKELAAAQAEAEAQTKFFEEQARAEQDRQAENNRLKQEQYDKYQAVADKYADTNIDSNRYWKNAQTSDKIMAGIGLLAGAFAQVRGVTDKNYGAEYIDRVIDRDIKEQEANLNKTGRDVEHQRTLYQDLRQQGIDQEAAAAKVREMAYKSLEAKMSVMSAAAKNEATKAHLDMQAADYKQKAADEAQKYNHTVTTSITKAVEAKPKEKIDSSVVEKNIEAKDAVMEAQKLEDGFKVLYAQHKAGGPLNAMIDQVKDQLGLATDTKETEVWKAYELALIKQRSKVFGASLTESERKAFERGATMWRAQPDILLNAIKNIREGSERAYVNRVNEFNRSGIPVPQPDIPIRYQREEQKKTEKMKPSYK